MMQYLHIMKHIFNGFNNDSHRYTYLCSYFQLITNLFRVLYFLNDVTFLVKQYLSFSIKKLNICMKIVKKNSRQYSQ